MFIKLTQCEGTVIYINKDMLAYFYKWSNYTRVQMIPINNRDNGTTYDYLTVKETPEQICEMLGVGV